jgi:aryl-alcohol dehydrogenase-like predicted oxidoreductase
MKVPALMTLKGINRRTFVATASGAALTAGLTGGIHSLQAADGPPILRAIPKSRHQVPVIGMGTWITFNVGSSNRLREARVRVLKAFFDSGGTMVDSSPMYGSSEDVVGYCLGRIDQRDRLFSATKVWTPLVDTGIDQMAASRALWGVQKFDLMQVHNLVNWEEHLETLAEDKAAGRVRHIGITTSHGSRHSEMARLMDDKRVDAVQFTYNLLDREAESRLLPMAAERGLAVVINRPFRRGDLFRRFAGKKPPDWAREFDCTNWAQFS